MYVELSFMELTTYRKFLKSMTSWYFLKNVQMCHLIWEVHIIREFTVNRVVDIGNK